MSLQTYASDGISVAPMSLAPHAYALAPFMADVAHVGAQVASAVGLVNAFQTGNLC